MASTDEAKIKLTAEVSEFNSAIKQAKSAITELNSELKLNQTQMSASGTSTEQLESRLATLQEKSKALASEEEALKSKLSATVAVYGENSTEAQRLQTQINNVQTQEARCEQEIQKTTEALESQKKAEEQANSTLGQLTSTISSQEKELAELKTQYTNVVLEEGKDSEAAKELEGKISDLNSELNTNKSKLSEAENAAESLTKAENTEKTAVEQLKSTIASQEKELESLKTQYTNVVLEEGKNSEAAQELAGKITTLDGELQNNKTKLSDAEKATDDLTKSETEMGDEAEDAGKKGAEGFQAMYDALVALGLIEAVKKLVEAMKSCVEAAAGFESQMSTVKALSGATADEMDLLTAAAKEMGATTSYTATEAGEALEYMALAGWSTDEMLDGLSSVINLAAASGEDLGTTTDIVTDALTAFGMEASDSAHFTDVLAAASTNSNTTVSQMGEAFKQVATTAGTLGYSVDDVSVALGIMADSGIKGSTAGSALSTALTRMSGTSSSATQELEKLGVSMYDDEGNTKELSVFLDELRTALNNNYDNAADLQVALYNLAGQRGMKGLAAIVNSTDEEFYGLTDAIATCDGTAEEMAAIKLDNFEGQVTLLKSAWDALMTTMGESALNILGDIVGAFTDIVSKIDEFLEQHPLVTAMLDGLCVGLVAAAGALVACAVACSDLKDKIIALTAAMADNQIGAIITAITILTGALATLAIYVANNKTEAQALREETHDLVEEVEREKEAYDDLVEENEKTKAGYEQLIGALDEYLGKTDKEESDRQAIIALVDQLNELIPDLNLNYDAETDSINMTTDALKEKANAYAGEEEYNALIERQSTLLQEQVRAEDDLTEAQKRYDAQLGNVTDSEELHAWQLGEITLATDQAYVGMSDYGGAVNEAQYALDEINGELEIVNAQINAYSDATSEAADTTEGKIMNAVEELAPDLIDLQNEYDATYQAALDSCEGQFDLWEQVDEVVKTSKDTILEALESQQKYWEDYTDNLENLNRRNIDGLNEYVAAIDDGTTDAAGKIASLADMTDEEIEEIIAAQKKATDAEHNWASEHSEIATGYSEETQQMVQDVCEYLKGLDQSDEMYQYAYDTFQGYLRGEVDEEGELVGEAEGISQDILDMIYETLGLGSPSYITEAYGEDTIQGLINGEQNKQGEATSTTQTIGQSILDAFNGLCNSNSLLGSGQDTVGGFITGANSQSGASVSTMTELATSNISNWTAIDNASSLVGSGQDTISGYITGATSERSAMTSSMSDLSKGAVTTFQNNSTGSSLRGSGSDTIQGYINGTSQQLSNLTAMMTSHALTAINTFMTLCNSSSLYGAGQDAIQGAINGVNSMGTSFSNTMANIANNAMNTFRNSLGVASPSWIAEEATEYFGEGAVIGVEKSGKALAAAMEGMGDTATEAFSLGAADVDFGAGAGIEYQGARQSYVETLIAASISGLAAQIAEMADEIASRPVYVQINGKTIVAATVGDYDSAMGTRQALAGRGLSL